VNANWTLCFSLRTVLDLHFRCSRYAWKYTTHATTISWFIQEENLDYLRQERHIIWEVKQWIESQRKCSSSNRIKKDSVWQCERHVTLERQFSHTA
jgi:hypothetical protein